MQRQKLFIAALALGLAACSSEPSAGDIEQALRAKMEVGQLVAGEFLGKKHAADLTFTLHDLKKIGCKSGESKTVYQCEAEVDATWPVFGRKKQTLPFVLIKGDQGWQMPG